MKGRELKFLNGSQKECILKSINGEIFGNNFLIIGVGNLDVVSVSSLKV